MNWLSFPSMEEMTVYSDVTEVMTTPPIQRNNEINLKLDWSPWLPLKLCLETSFIQKSEPVDDTSLQEIRMSIFFNGSFIRYLSVQHLRSEMLQVLNMAFNYGWTEIQIERIISLGTRPLYWVTGHPNIRQKPGTDFCIRLDTEYMLEVHASKLPFV